MLVEDVGTIATTGTSPGSSVDLIAELWFADDNNVSYGGAVTLVDEGDWGTNKRILTCRNHSGIGYSGTSGGNPFIGPVGNTTMWATIKTYHQSSAMETRIHAISMAWA